MDLDMSLPNATSWFPQLEMEDPMILARECLVGSQIGVEDEMEMAMGGFMFRTRYSLSSSSSECNSSSSNNTNSNPFKILSFGARNDNNVVQPEPEPEPELEYEYPQRVKRQKRKAEQCHNHIIAERERRRNLSQGFIALSALVPGLKKMDKTSILGEAINHMKQLKERLKILEELPETCRRSRVEVVKIMVPDNRTRSSSSPPPSSSSSSVNHSHNNDDDDDQAPDIEARFSDTCVLIKIQCQRQKGILTKIVAHIENLRLSVNTANAMPFDNTFFDITISATMDPGFDMTPQAVVTSICSVFK